MARKIALQLAYDGTNFVGSQWQAQGRSVQGVLEQSWSRFAQEQQRFIFAGRTDAGVHARGQVVHVTTESAHPLATVQRALNALLPDDVRVLDVWDVADDFHARYSARWRKYRYLIDTHALPLPMLRHYVLHVGQTLDSAAIQEALHVLPGEHDFAAFATLGDYQGSTVRCCYHATCELQHWADRPVLAIELVANGFLRHMVRALVGTLLLVGQQRLSPAEFAQILDSRERRQAGPTAAAHGLMLMAVGYSEPDNGQMNECEE
jgi:tRNA pseudouridine38-40 synthase